MRETYLPGITFPEYFSYMRAFPRFAVTLPPDAAQFAPVTAVLELGNEFDTDRGGRGDSYRNAQRRTDARLTGIRSLLELCLDRPVPHEWPDDLRVLDVLGGDGTIARALAALRPGTTGDRQWILTSDLSRYVVAGAIGYGLPTPEAARRELCAYVADMYGLAGLRRDPDWEPRLWELIGRHMSAPAAVRRNGQGYVAVMPREALVGVAVKR